MEVDLRLTDLSRSGGDGIDLARAARNHIPGLPVIILTNRRGMAATHAIEHAIGDPCSVLRKPIRLSALPDEVMIVLRRSRDRAATLAAVKA